MICCRFFLLHSFGFHSDLGRQQQPSLLPSSRLSSYTKQLTKKVNSNMYRNNIPIVANMQNDLRNGIIVVMPIPKATRFVKDVTVMDMPVNKETQIYIALERKK